MTQKAQRRKKHGSVALVGTGPGDAALLTLAALEAMRAADLVVHDADVDESLLALIPGAERVPFEDGSVTELVAAARDGREVVLLVLGDALAAPHAVALGLAAAKAKLRLTVVPAVTAEAAAATYAGIPLGRSHTFVELGAAGDPDWAGLAGAPGTLVLSASSALVGKAAASLVEHGRRGDTPVSVTASGATTRQVTVVSTLDGVEAELTAALRPRGGPPAGSLPVVVIVGEVVRQRERLSWWEGRPLFGWSVLVPRTREQGSALSVTLRLLGAEPLEVPTIAVEPPRTPAPMERALRGLIGGRYAWVAFTSANAVKAMREKLEESGLDARAFAGIKLAAVGDATAAALADFGLRADLVPAGVQSSEGLLEVWPPRDEQLDVLDRVLLPRADIATEALAAGLKARGWSIDDLTAYRTVRASPPSPQVREAIRAGRIHAVLFTSSSTVRNLVGIAGKPHENTVIGVIGPQTAIAAEELGLRVDVQASSPNVETLARELADFALARRAALAAEPAEPAEPAAQVAAGKTTAPRVRRR